MKLKERYLILILLLTAFILRIINFGFPFFTAVEVRMANSSPLTTIIGARVPYLILGMALVFLSFRFAKEYSNRKNFAFWTGLFVSFSPPLIYLSRVPNREILFLTALMLLFFLYLKTAGRGKKKKTIKSVLLLLAAAGLYIFFVIQNTPFFSLFSDMGIFNGINIFRSQGFITGVNPLLGRILFNKTYYLVGGLFHWLSSLSPSVLFGRFDVSGIWGPMSMGAWPKVLIIPSLAGLVYLIRKSSRRDKYLTGVILLMTFPSFFFYPLKELRLIVLVLPLMAIIITLGFLSLSKLAKTVVVILMVSEVMMNFVFVSQEMKRTGLARPGWIKPVIEEALTYAESKEVVLSDDLVDGLKDHVEYFDENLSSKITYANSDNVFIRCLKEESTKAIVGKRDIAFIEKYITDVKTEKVFFDSAGQEAAYLMEEKLCLR